jgi:hypothetical protein
MGSRKQAPKQLLPPAAGFANVKRIGKEPFMELPPFSSRPFNPPLRAATPNNKTGEDCPRRSWLRNAFEQVYPLGG